MSSSKKISLSPQKAKQLTPQLVAWYRESHRALPWRETTSAYEIWLSEIMLQQTQVETVLPYYARFLEAFPTVSDLAAAPQDRVLKLWEGLGYYARARNLHRAAQLVVEEHQGVFPTVFEDILALPGIGQSTAGAISTFTHAKPMPILDGNVKRVLSRLTGCTAPIDDKTVLDQLWAVSLKLLPKKDFNEAYDFNQAIMELGATCCTTKSPQCSCCPWQDNCVAYEKQLQELIPHKAKKNKSPHFTIGVGVVFNEQGEVLIALRPEKGLLAGLWEFPGGKCEADETLAACVKRELKEETGLDVEVKTHITTVKHAYTHFKITLHAYRCELISGIAEPKASQALRWVSVDDLSHFAFPKANHAILEYLQQSSQSPRRNSQVEQTVLF